MPAEQIHTIDTDIGFKREPLQVTPASLARPVSTVNHKNYNFRTWRHRPTSTPLSSSQPSMMSPVVSRPKTATFAYGHIECDRVCQEPTRRHKFENHLPLKRAKSAPWRKDLVDAPVRQQVHHGYILSRSKTANHVTITEEFFQPFPEEISSVKKKVHVGQERDSLVLKLQQQISDLTLYLEEERLNHKQSKQKAEEFLRDKIDQLNCKYQEEIRDLQAEHTEELQKQKQVMEARHKADQAVLETQIRRVTKDNEFLQSAFEVYKGSLQMEAAKKLKSIEDEQKFKFAEEKQQAIHEIKTRHIQDWNQERTTMIKEHQKVVENLRKENRMKMDSLVQRFSNAAADIEKLKETTAELNETKLELADLKERHKTTSEQLISLSNQLTDAKFRLAEFEERFDEKLSQVDDRYRQKLQELVTQNTELKRRFVQKCGELFDEKTNSDDKMAARTKSAKETLERLIKSKHEASASVKQGKSKQKNEVRDSRPISAGDANGEMMIANEVAEHTRIQDKQGMTTQTDICFHDKFLFYENEEK